MQLGAFGLENKAAVITGAASGIGRATSELFVQAGARVVMADVDEDVNNAAATFGSRATAVRINLAEEGAPALLAAQAETIAPIDIWVNVAGVIGYTPFGSVTREEYDRIIRINLDAVYWCCAAIVPAMRRRRGGTIINVSSNAADQPMANLSVYAFTKAAVNMLTKTLAVELGPDGIRANALAPGFVVTGMTAPQSLGNAERDALLAIHAARSALGITGTPLDMAQALLFLASDASAFMTGQILRVNGGTSML